MSSNKRDKYFKYQLLLGYPGLEAHNPKTDLFTKENLFKMMELRDEIIVKPIIGNGGKGVIKVTKTDNRIFKINRRKATLLFHDKNSLLNYLQKAEEKKKKPFIIQHYIPLAKIDGRPIDFRYIVQRKKGTTDWTITGKHAKVAPAGYFVTNLKQGAEILSVEEALEQSNLIDVSIQETLKVLDQIALLATECLTIQFKNHTIWGYDLAVDESGHVWIIEANSIPLLGGFRLLEDRSMYESMMSIIESNGEAYTSKGWQRGRQR